MFLVRLVCMCFWGRGRLAGWGISGEVKSCAADIAIGFFVGTDDWVTGRAAIE